MTIYRADREKQAEKVYERLLQVHTGFTNLAAKIRNLPTVTTWFLLGRINGLTGEYQGFASFNDAYGANGTGWFATTYGANVQTALTGVIASFQNINADWQAILNNYEAASGNTELVDLSAADKDAAAQAIEDELQ